jgi:hypothetical protein
MSYLPNQLIIMKTKLLSQVLRHPFIVLTILALSPIAHADTTTRPPEKSVVAPHSQTISVKSITPVAQPTDLQIFCIVKHNPAGDKYIDAMAVLDQKLHGLLSSLRDRNEFTGDLGETLLITPPPNSIVPKQILFIGIGDESDISLDKLQLIGSIAASESVRLKAAHVSFAPTLRDQGSTCVDVADGDAAFTTGWILAYDTEKKLQDQNLSPAFDVATLTIEAGSKFFETAAQKVAGAVQTQTAAVQARSTDPYMK